MQLGFIGAGRLAAPMIANLAADGHEVRVWNRDRAKAEQLAGGRVRVADSAAAACRPGGIVFSCLADDVALDAVCTDGTVLEALGLAGVHVSISTVSAPCAERLAAAHEAAGAHYVAAPLIGRPDAVAARAQSWLLAGTQAAKARVRDLLEALGRRVFDFGEAPPAANLAKINFNFLLASAI
ncbi:MAG: NAD(P)-binding domain-containing protein [Gammaproteobacteria bacterium]